MRSLFVKIFVWFWLTLATVMLVNYLTVFTTLQSNLRERFSTGPSTVFATTAVEKLEHDGGKEASQYLDLIEQQALLRAFIFDGDGNELTGRSPSQGATEAAIRLGQNEHQFSRSEEGNFLARRVIGSLGNRYVFVAEMRPPPVLRYFPFLPRVWWVQFIAVILTTGALCYLLAKYFSTPLVKLREATRRLAGGDLTARVGSTQRRDELADVGRDFDIMAERIETLMTTQQRLLHDISHELRSPLSRLDIALELVRQESAPEANWALERIERESQRLNTLIDQLLILARMENARAPEKHKLISLQNLIEDVAMDADFEASSYEKTVKVTHSEACYLKGDEQLLRSAIENVVRNAILYTPEGAEVEIRMTRERSVDGQHALIEIQDQGSGVPQEALSEIFKPFYRVGDARDRESGGAGLGLSISQRAVEVHGGSISARNAPKGGLLVSIVLPGTFQTSSEKIADLEKEELEHPSLSRH
jgi:two-component system sensor histidine kinase CpxA